jgi:CheY-like chemotaxis protein
VILTDVVMPGCSGPELVRRLAPIHATPVVFMSGYAADPVAFGGVVREGTHLLNKPFSAEELAAKLAAALTS